MENLLLCLHCSTTCWNCYQERQRD